MNNKLAIIIVGDSDTGKSTLLKELVNKFSIRRNTDDIKRACKGTRKLFFDVDQTLTQEAYIIFSSPSEEEEFKNLNFTIGNFINDENVFSNIRVLIYPDHPNNNIHSRNKKFLIENGFEIKEFTIRKDDSLKHWSYTEENLNSTDINKRVKDIVSLVKAYSSQK